MFEKNRDRHEKLRHCKTGSTLYITNYSIAGPGKGIVTGNHDRPAENKALQTKTKALQGGEEAL
ncbi:MAG: hypothetical protein GY940_45520 [bacterium]|nr:hypothetical protein [bacterium]